MGAAREGKLSFSIHMFVLFILMLPSHLFFWILSFSNKLLLKGDDHNWSQRSRWLHTINLGHGIIILPALNLNPLLIHLDILFASWSLLCTEQMFSWSCLQWQQDLFLEWLQLIYNSAMCMSSWIVLSSVYHLEFICSEFHLSWMLCRQFSLAI